MDTVIFVDELKYHWPIVCTLYLSIKICGFSLFSLLSMAIKKYSQLYQNVYFIESVLGIVLNENDQMRCGLGVAHTNY